MRLSSCLFTLLAAAACADGRPARLVVGPSDTVVVNNRGPARLGVAVRDARGRALDSTGVRYRWVSGDPVRVSDDGVVRCARNGDAVVHASHGPLSARMFVLCRPIAGFRWFRDNQLVLDGPARVLDLNAVGTDGRPVTLLAATASRRSRLVDLQGLRVSPNAPGHTRVDVEAGDCETAVSVEVVEQVLFAQNLTRPYQQFVRSPLSLVGGEMRSWRIPRGTYQLSLRPSLGDSLGLVLETAAINCASNRWHQDYYCVALEGATVVVRNPRPAGDARALVGHLFVTRRGDWASQDVERPPPRGLRARRMAECDV